MQVESKSEYKRVTTVMKGQIEELKRQIVEANELLKFAYIEWREGESLESPMLNIKDYLKKIESIK